MVSICPLFKCLGCLVFKWHLKTRPFGIQTIFDHLNTRLVWYSDPHCSPNNSFQIFIVLIHKTSSTWHLNLLVRNMFFIQTILSSTSSPLGLLSVGNCLLIEWLSPGRLGIFIHYLNTELVIIQISTVLNLN